MKNNHLTTTTEIVKEEMALTAVTITKMQKQFIFTPKEV